MIFEPRTIILKDGRECVLRPTHPDDSADMIEYMRRTAGETEFLLRYPDEVSFTLEQEQQLLGSILNDPGNVMMVAVVDGRVAGNASINGIGAKRKIRHRCSLAIALYRDYWGLGIGTAMIGYLTELARQIGFSQIDLEVVAENEQALALYRKCGFVESGRRVNALKFDDGTYHDEILMIKKLPAEQA
jgi:RimJ/RimL family protein N-acetyltransferase